jgi:hypothetical protein
MPRSHRFQSRYDLRGLVDVVAQVARVAAPAEPERVTQRSYDSARAKAGYPDAPSARQTASRLRMSWPELVAFALRGREIEKTLGIHFGDEDEPHLGEEDVRSALRVVALRLRKKSLARADYIGERERMLAAARRRWCHRSALSLPSANQIERIAGGWEAALTIAGLGPRPAQARSRGLEVIEALELALEAHGSLVPSRAALELFAAANNFSLARFETGKPWGDYLAELKARRDEWGKWTPTAAPAREVRPDYTQPIALPPEMPRRRKKRWTREECLAALAGLLAELGARERLTQRRYQEEAKGRAELPALRSLQRYGSFTELVAEARKRRARAPLAK